MTNRQGKKLKGLVARKNVIPYSCNYMNSTSIVVSSSKQGNMDINFNRLHPWFGKSVTLLTVSSSAKSSERSQLLSLRVMANYIAQALSPIIFGSLSSVAGLSPVLWCAGSILFCAGIAMRRIENKRKQNLTQYNSGEIISVAEATPSKDSIKHATNRYPFGMVTIPTNNDCKSK